MAAPRKLRRYSWASVTLATWGDLTPVVPAGRALVGNVVVANAGSAGNTVTFSLSVGNPAPQQAEILAQFVKLGPGQTWEHKGVVLLAGEQINIVHRESGAVSELAASFFGEEVDD